MEEDQRNARIFGVLFLITFITSIPALALYQPVLDDPAAYIAGGGEDNKIYLGVLLELLLIIANVGTAVVVFPILRRQNEILALGYVTARIVECVFIAAGIIFVLGIVSLRQDGPERLRARRFARRAQGLDVPARPRLHRRLGERADPRLPDVQLPPRATGDGDAGPHRWATDHPLGDRRAVRRRGTQAARCRPSRRSRSSSGSCHSASTPPCGGSSGILRSSRRPRVDARARPGLNGISLR